MEDDYSMACEEDLLVWTSIYIVGVRIDLMGAAITL
jgi:hypothetical protein